LIGGICVTYGERRNECGVVVGKIDRDLGVNRRNLKGIGWKAADWIHLAKSSDN